jgi:tetratricopeptide (TPR) repeat protein
VTGLIPIFSKGSISASVVQGLGIEVPNSTPREFASAVINCLAYPDRTENLKALLRSDSKESIRSTLVGKLVARVLEAENGRVNRNSSHAAAIQRIDEIVARGEIFDAYLEVERLLLLDIQSPQIKSAALRIKGDCLSAQDNFEGALDAYQQSLHEDSNNYKALKGLGFIAWHSHSNEEAITFFRKAHALHSEDSQVMLGLGLVYKRVGLLEQAIFWFEKSVGLDAQATAALAALTQACNEHPKPTFAIEALRRTIDTIGERPSLLMTLGNILVKNGQVAEGRMLLARALDRNSA